ncbi:hypothetical protein Hanom_Chr17g01584341 [Helianthus anomalus]
MNDHDNCREFFSLSPPAERLFQKRRNRFDLLDDHIHVVVNFFATSQENVREWKLMGEKFNAERKGLLWRVSDAEQKLAKEKQILVEEVSADCKWLLARIVPLISECIVGSEELAKYMYKLGEAARALGCKKGYAEGRAAAESKEPLKNFELYKTDCVARYAEKRQEFESLEFAIVKAAGKLSRKPDGVALLKRALGEEDHEAEGAGTSRQG